METARAKKIFKKHLTNQAKYDIIIMFQENTIKRKRGNENVVCIIFYFRILANV